MWHIFSATSSKSTVVDSAWHVFFFLGIAFMFKDILPLSEGWRFKASL